MIVPFYDTEYQSIAIGLTVGIVLGVFSVFVGSLSISLIFATVVAVILEIAVHEYRDDEHYVQAKRIFYNFMR